MLNAAVAFAGARHAGHLPYRLCTSFRPRHPLGGTNLWSLSFAHSWVGCW